MFLVVRVEKEEAVVPSNTQIEPQLGCCMDHFAGLARWELPGCRRNVSWGLRPLAREIKTNSHWGGGNKFSFWFTWRGRRNTLIKAGKYCLPTYFLLFDVHSNCILHMRWLCLKVVKLHDLGFSAQVFPKPEKKLYLLYLVALLVAFFLKKK